MHSKYPYNYNFNDCTYWYPSIFIHCVATRPKIQFKQPTSRNSSALLHALQNDSEFYYTVQPGDSIFLISQNFDISMDEIIEDNKLVSPYVIYPGQRLIIRGENVSLPRPNGRIYIVQPNDTLFEIAQMFNTNLDAILNMNTLANPDLIYPGQRLIIPIV